MPHTNTLKAIRLRGEAKNAERRATEAEVRRTKEAEAEQKRDIRRAEDELHEQEVPGLTSVILEEAGAFHKAIMNAPEEVRIDLGQELKIRDDLTWAQRMLPKWFQPTFTVKAGWIMGYLYEAEGYVMTFIAGDGVLYVTAPDEHGGWNNPLLKEMTRSSLEAMGYNLVGEILQELRVQRQRFDTKTQEHSKAQNAQV